VAGLVIRKATLNDIKGIQNIHRDCDDPWHNETECKNWVEKRLDRGFYIQVAVLNGKVVGHGEWIVSDEPDKKFLYLGMLQIDSDYQRQGIGRAMLSDGQYYARQNGCSSIITIPDNDTGSVSFYSKCGFTQGRKIKQIKVPTMMYTGYDPYNKRIDFVPFSVTKELLFIFGLSQISSRHMWEICNEPPKGDDRATPAIKTAEGDFVQFSYYEPSDTGLVLCWSASNNTDRLLINILGFGYECGLKYVTFIFFEQYEHFFNRLNTEVVDNTDIELIKCI
jgi:ribosomal protein S18 acetylase RimI-like enzyme